MSDERVPITDTRAVLHRVVVDPAWVSGSHVSPQAFMPRPQDNTSLSTNNKGITAKQALAQWNQRFKARNAVVSVLVGHCLDLGLGVFDDSGPAGTHVAVDFPEDPSLIELLAELLARNCSVWCPV